MTFLDHVLEFFLFWDFWGDLQYFIETPHWMCTNVWRPLRFRFLLPYQEPKDTNKSSDPLSSTNPDHMVGGGGGGGGAKQKRGEEKKKKNFLYQATFLNKTKRSRAKIKNSKTMTILCQCTLTLFYILHG